MIQMVGKTHEQRNNNSILKSFGDNRGYNSIWRNELKSHLKKGSLVMTNNINTDINTDITELDHNKTNEY